MAEIQKHPKCTNPDEAVDLFAEAAAWCRKYKAKITWPEYVAARGLSRWNCEKFNADAICPAFGTPAR